MKKKTQQQQKQKTCYVNPFKKTLWLRCRYPRRVFTGLAYVWIKKSALTPSCFYR